MLRLESKDQTHKVKEGLKLIVVREEGGDVRVQQREMIGRGLNSKQPQMRESKHAKCFM